MRQKPKMEVLLTKSDVFDEVVASEAQRYGTYEVGARCRQPLSFASFVPAHLGLHVPSTQP